MGTSAVVLGELTEREREGLQRAAARAQTTLSFQPDLARALGRLKQAACVFIDQEAAIAEAIDHVRDDASLFALPMIVIAEAPSPELWLSAYAQGADDVVLKRDAGGITRRLLTIGDSPAAQRPDAVLGRAVIASEEDTSRRRIGRTLRNVGFEIAYAGTVEEAVANKQPAFVVTTAAAPAGELGGVAYVGGVPVLYLGEQAAFVPVHDRITDASARVLFFADEQARAKFRDRRVSARKLWAELCSFREAGMLEPNYGMTHNISREGLYVRSLDPPRVGTELWLELRAPATETPVHLRARVMWQRPAGAKFGVVPPGFGLRLEPERCPATDLQSFVEAYDRLA